jgi:hypothetical protein
MIARLTAFYGVDPWRLLAELPLGILRALSKMLPRLQAEQSIEAADQIAVGVPLAFAGEGKAAIRRWRDVLPSTAQPSTGAPASPQQLAGSGIGHRLVPKVSHGG